MTQTWILYGAICLLAFCCLALLIRIERLEDWRRSMESRE